MNVRGRLRDGDRWIIVEFIDGTAVDPNTQMTIGGRVFEVGELNFPAGNPTYELKLVRGDLDRTAIAADYYVEDVIAS